LNGKGFKKLVNQNIAVKKGDKIIKVDRDFIESSGFNCITMMVVIDKNNFDFKFLTDGKVSKGTSVVATY
jgi:phosphotransferase system IIA component